MKSSTSCGTLSCPTWSSCRMLQAHGRALSYIHTECFFYGTCHQLATHATLEQAKLKVKVQESVGRPGSSCSRSRFQNGRSGCGKMNANRKSEDYVTKQHAVVEVTSWCKNMRIAALGERQKSWKRVLFHSSGRLISLPVRSWPSSSTSVCPQAWFRQGGTCDSKKSCKHLQWQHGDKMIFDSIMIMQLSERSKDRVSSFGSPQTFAACTFEAKCCFLEALWGFASFATSNGQARQSGRDNLYIYIHVFVWGRDNNIYIYISHMYYMVNDVLKII